MWSLVPLESWRHCAGVSNPADIPSRGIGCLDVTEVWLEGPERLKAPLQLHGEHLVPDECMTELRSEDRTLVMYNVLGNPTSIIDPTQFSTLRRLRRVVAQIVRFIRGIK